MAVVGYRTKETSATTGLGSYSLGGAAFGFQSFVEAVGDGVEVFYVAEDLDFDLETGNWEVGLGTVTDGSPDTLSRTTILASSQGGAKVNWGTGTRNVFSAHPASAFMVGANNLSEIVSEGSVGTARTNLGLGSSATHSEDDFVAAAGDTMTGLLLLSGDPAAALGAATKQYVDAVSTVANAALARSGGTMTGKITLDGDPSSALHAVTKQYVDGLPAFSLTVEESDGAPTVSGVTRLEFNQAHGFAVVNEGSGGVRVDISGKVPDSDLLDGLSSSAFSLSSHDHDSDYEPVFPSGTRLAVYSSTKPGTWSWLNFGERFSIIDDSGTGTTGQTGNFNWGQGVTVTVNAHALTAAEAPGLLSAVTQSGSGTNRVISYFGDGAGHSHTASAGSTSSWRPAWIKARVANKD